MFNPSVLPVVGVRQGATGPGLRSRATARPSSNLIPCPATWSEVSNLVVRLRKLSGSRRLCVCMHGHLVPTGVVWGFITWPPGRHASKKEKKNTSFSEWDRSTSESSRSRPNKRELRVLCAWDWIRAPTFNATSDLLMPGWPVWALEPHINAHASTGVAAATVTREVCLRRF